ncbi:MAG TPA: hypothetical protein VL125_06715 [Pelobium sp.]|nr:hypothetical protein [Pelobium sp.]
MINDKYPFSDLTEALLALVQDFKPTDWDKKTLLNNCKVSILINHLINTHIAILNQLDPNFTLNTNTDITINLINEQIKKLELAMKNGTDLKHVKENQYCNCWLRQQYVRQALNNQHLLKRVFYFPFLNMVMQNFANHYQKINAEIGTILKVEIVGEAGGVWIIQKQQIGWQNIEPKNNDADVTIYLDQQLAWLLFDGALNLNEIGQYYQIIGNNQMGNHFLNLRI